MFQGQPGKRKLSRRIVAVVVVMALTVFGLGSTAFADGGHGGWRHHSHHQRHHGNHRHYHQHQGHHGHHGHHGNGSNSDDDQSTGTDDDTTGTDDSVCTTDDQSTGVDDESTDTEDTTGVDDEDSADVDDEDATDVDDEDSADVDEEDSADVDDEDATDVDDQDVTCTDDESTGADDESTGADDEDTTGVDDEDTTGVGDEDTTGSDDEDATGSDDDQSTGADDEDTSDTDGSADSGDSDSSSTDGLSDPKKKDVAMQIVSSAENSTLDWKAQYGYIEDIGDGRGYTAGIIGFCSGCGDMQELIHYYNSIAPNNVLQKYTDTLDGIGAWDDTHDGLGDAFVKDWKTAAKDAKFQQAQDHMRDTMYFNPAVSQAKADGLGALGQFIYYDAMVVHGPGSDSMSFGGIVKAAKAKAKTPAQGGDEGTYLNAFMDARVKVMQAEEAHEDVTRIENAQRVWVKNKNFNLDLPLSWSVYGDKYSITK